MLAEPAPKQLLRSVIPAALLAPEQVAALALDADPDQVVVRHDDSAKKKAGGGEAEAS